MFQRLILAAAVVASVFGGHAIYTNVADSIAERQCYTVKGGTFYGPIGDPNSTGPNFCFDADKRRVG